MNFIYKKLYIIIFITFALAPLPILHVFGLNSKVSGYSYADNSVLKSGKWYKFSIIKNGVYKISYDFLKQIGATNETIKSDKIKIFGYGNGTLPELNNLSIIDDLPQIAIEVFDGGDGELNTGDYILFYAESPNKWIYNNEDKCFNYEKNIYSNKSFYFLTTDGPIGKRVENIETNSDNVNNIINDFNYYEAIKIEKKNLLSSGKKWVGDELGYVENYIYNFNIKNHNSSSEVKLLVNIAAKVKNETLLKIKYGENSFKMQLPSLPFNSDRVAHIVENTFQTYNATDINNLKIEFLRPFIEDKVWINQLVINTLCNLVYDNEQFNFRKLALSGKSKFVLTTNASNLKVLDITDHLNPKRVKLNFQSNISYFYAESDTLHEFIAYSDDNAIKPEFVEIVDNQNLHAIENVEMVIVAHNNFIGQATRLATFHSQQNNILSIVTTPEKIYNEFSSGRQDISAIRNFLKMLYCKNNKTLKYFLLFGNASYDYKNIITPNHNFVPTWFSNESFIESSSYPSDDFFGCFDENEGGTLRDLVDIGIGRLPITNSDEADILVDKIIAYMSNSESNSSKWRNIITLVADVDKGNTYLYRSESYASLIESKSNDILVDKIYSDAYTHLSTVTGVSSPDATRAIFDRVNNGALIINYTGHGGATGWSRYNLLRIADIESWRNKNKLPFFITGTCEFARYDNPHVKSAGELILLKENGGGIGLLTTSRPTYGTPNNTLTSNFFNSLFLKNNNKYLTIGELTKKAKQINDLDDNRFKFILLGDPALTLAMPNLNVKTLEINGNKVEINKNDTLKAASFVSIKGCITNDNKNIITDFNGIVEISVYDKIKPTTTLGYFGTTAIFNSYKSLIYKGLANVNNGYFTISFYVPYDIDYNFGQGKIFYYATNYSVDAKGSYNAIVVGGFNEDQISDNDGPDIKLFMNNEKFKNGDMTDQNPLLLIKLKDKSGINTSGIGLGHDITAVIDDKYDAKIVLNNFYEANINTFAEGKIAYQLNNLADGDHNVKIRVYDVFNNASDKEIDFTVYNNNSALNIALTLAPNPIDRHSKLYINHNYSNKNLDINLIIYNMLGQIVYETNYKYKDDGFVIELTDFYDKKAMKNKLYILKIKASTIDGFKDVKTIKFSAI